MCETGKLVTYVDHNVAIGIMLLTGIDTHLLATLTFDHGCILLHPMQKYRYTGAFAFYGSNY